MHVFSLINTRERKSSQEYPVYAPHKLTNDRYRSRPHLCLNLLAKDVLERHGVGCKLGNTLAELLNGHLVLVEVEAEVGLVVNVRLLLEVERAGV
jgi:hypothetical protein